jgi:hypothetical protein
MEFSLFCQEDGIFVVFESLLNSVLKYSLVPECLVGNCVIVIDLHFFVMMEFVGADRLVSRNNGVYKRELPSPKDGPFAHIAAQTFTFRELAAATKNFRPESFLGEGGFGRVYKGRLDSTGQVIP